MMGGRLACADCLGPDGRGGKRVVHMTVINAPDIRWATLTETEHGEQGNHDQGEEGEMDHPPYTEETFKRAVSQGLDPGGNPLDPAMPRGNSQPPQRQQKQFALDILKAAMAGARSAGKSTKICAGTWARCRVA